MESTIMHSNSSALLVFTLVLAAGLPGSTLATYKWTDDEGNVHYSQRPPSGRAAEKLKAPSKVDTDGAQKELERIQQQSDTYVEERGKLKEERAKTEQEREKKKAACNRAREELNGVIAHYRVYVTNEAGERIRQNEEQRQAREKAANDNIAKFCG